MIMEMERRHSKRGSFLSFFDWNGKFQKKLVCDNPNLPAAEVSNQGKENVDIMPNPQLNRIKEEDCGANPSDVASCDFDCALSITSVDEGCGSTKAPGLVARLMGLDSFPASTVTELSSSSLYGSESSDSHGSFYCCDGSLHLVDDCCPDDCIITMPLKPEKYSLGAVDSEARKVGNPAAIRRFQTETLPPKSAKPIPVTRNKLLSTNAAQIREAAAKIIEASPQRNTRDRISPVGPSSVPLRRILNLKEQLEAAQYASKLVDCRTSNTANGKPNDKPNERSSNLYIGTPMFKGSRNSEKNSSRRFESKGKSASLAIQSKANDVQSCDTSTLNGKRGYMKQKEENEIKPNQLSRGQKKRVTDQNSSVLERNNQKQNTATNKGKSTSKVESNKPTARTWSSESSSGAKKTTNKGAVNGNFEPKRSSLAVIDIQKKFTASTRKSISQKTRYTGRDAQNEARCSDSDNMVNNCEIKSIKCNITTDGSTEQNAVSMEGSKDVISFTFTTPLRRNMPKSQSSTQQVTGTNNRIDPKKLSLSTPGLDMIDSDTLSVLLEEKLKELTSRINRSQCTLASEESSAGLRFGLEDNLHSLVSTVARVHDRTFHHDLLCNKSERFHGGGCSSCDNLVLTMNRQLKTAEPMEEPSCSNSKSGNDLGFQYSRTITVSENPSVSESRLDSEDSTYGSMVYSSTQDEEVSNCPLTNESVSVENGVKWSTSSMAIKHTSGTSNAVGFKRPTRNMELEYIKGILSNAELMSEEFAIGETNKVIMPSLFDQLENQGNAAEKYKEYSKLERKVLFDTASECLESRCRKASVGSCKAWAKWAASVKRKSLLAEELYKEVLGFRSMEEGEEELVRKDMSIGLGRWVDFDIEAFEEGLDFELDIVTNLINELVSDLMLL